MTNNGSYVPNPEGKGFAMTSEGKQKQKMEKQRRIGIIEKIVNNEGFKSISHLQRKLEEEYDISVTRQCLHNDLETLNKRGKHYKRTAISILASYRAKMNKINDMIKEEEDTKELRMLYKLWSKFAKDYATVVSKLGAAADAAYKSEPNKPQEVSISFEDEVKDE